MKVLWHANAPHTPSGYGQQTALFTPLMRDAGHDVAISANYGVTGRVTEWEGMKVYPADSDWGNVWLSMNAYDHGDGDPFAVQVITLMDVWVLHAKFLSQLHLASWVPIDHIPPPPNVVDYFRATGAVPIAMSRFGEEQLAWSGLEPLYVPHGVDTERMRPTSRVALREKCGIDSDAFVVGMVAANQGVVSRKAFPAAFRAFAIFQQSHPDAVLYLHSNLDGGISLPAWLDLCGIKQASVKVTPQSDMHLGIAYDAMSDIYSGLDVLLSPSYGEGFGVPIIEAQACGTPVIVNDFSAMPEICGAGWKADGIPVAHEAQRAWWQAPSIASIVDALDDAYEKAAGLREQAREFAVGYDTRRVMADYWMPALATLEERMGAKRLTPKPLRPRSSSRPGKAHRGAHKPRQAA